MKHINIPLFIQHMGCPNQCVFCDQRAITGAPSFCYEKVTKDIESVLSTAGEAECEIAFFGGSFTGIDRTLMINLLNIAQSYVESGRVKGIRMSTRPDYISEEICDILSKYTISQIELGIQSMSDDVLIASKRGHTAEQTKIACRLLNDRGVSFGGQMMVGLPGSNSESEIETAKAICAMGAESTRIYPLVVFRKTPLADMTARGEYVPLSVEEAVERAANVYEVFLGNNVKCLKIGLHETESLHNEASYLAGPNHSAMGELVKGEIYRRRIIEKTGALYDIKNKILLIEAPKGSTSKIIGQKGSNKRKIIDELGVKNIKILEKQDLMEYNIYVKLFWKRDKCLK